MSGITGLIRKILLSISPKITEHFGSFYSKVLLPMLPVGLCAPKKKIGKYGPFRFHPRFLFRDFSSWGNEHNSGFEACVEACRGKKCVFDIGGHIGLVSIPMSCMMEEEGCVYTFEPATVNGRFLRENIRLNNIGNINVFDCLVGSEHGKEIDFFEQENDTGLNSVVVKKDPEAFQKTTREQITIDHFCTEHNLKPELLKIDVEGAEFDVLKGAEKTLKKYRPVIFLSLHPEHLKIMGRKMDELQDICNLLTYECVNIDGSPIKEYALQEYLMRPLSV